MAGIKMTHAFDKKGVKWGADTYAKGMGTAPLKCEQRNATVIHVNSFTRDCYDNLYKVGAFFRLQANGAHGPNCRFGVDKEIVELASTSDSLFESVQKNRFRMRLVAVTEELKANATRHTGNEDQRRRDSPRCRAALLGARRLESLRRACTAADQAIADNLLRTG